MIFGLLNFLPTAAVWGIPGRLDQVFVAEVHA